MGVKPVHDDDEGSILGGRDEETDLCRGGQPRPESTRQNSNNLCMRIHQRSREDREVGLGGAGELRSRPDPRTVTTPQYISPAQRWLQATGTDRRC